MLCKACNMNIVPGEILRCTKCKVFFHYRCVNMNTAYFMGHRHDLVNSWACPECVCKSRSVRKDDTPVRGSLVPTLNDTITIVSNADLTQEHNVSLVEQPGSSDAEGVKNVLEEEAGGFENVTIRKPKDQQPIVKETSPLAFANSFSEDTLSLESVRSVMREELQRMVENRLSILISKIVSEQLASKFQIELKDLTERVSSLERKIGMMESGAVSPDKAEYSAVVRTGSTSGNTSKTTHGITPGTIAGTASGITSLTNFTGAANQNLSTSKEGKSTSRSLPALPVKQAKRDMQQSTTSVLPATNPRPVETSNDMAKESEWTVVKGKSKETKTVRTEIRKGGNKEIKNLQAIERKKYLHVWSLHPETSNEAMLEHVISVCGIHKEDISVEKVVSKAKRDYASFKIGVAESQYEKISVPEVWPLNARFSEWVWFRTFRKTI